MQIDIVILPKKDLRKRLGQKIVAAAKGVACRFLVDGKKLQHHMSLYHIKVRSGNFQELLAKTQAIAKRQKKFRVQTKAFAVHAEGVMGLDFQRSRPWEALQGKLVRACAPLRSGMVNWPYKRQPNRQETRFLKNFGSTFLYPLMKPHFTMGRLVEGESGQKILRLMKGIRFSFVADTLAVCLANKDHQVTKVLETYKLK